MLLGVGEMRRRGVRSHKVNCLLVRRLHGKWGGAAGGAEVKLNSAVGCDRTISLGQIYIDTGYRLGLSLEDGAHDFKIAKYTVLSLLSGLVITQCIYRIGLTLPIMDRASRGNL